MLYLSGTNDLLKLGTSCSWFWWHVAIPFVCEPPPDSAYIRVLHEDPKALRGLRRSYLCS